jgi:hypothetical protein
MSLNSAAFGSSSESIEQLIKDKASVASLLQDESFMSEVKMQNTKLIA